jgi:CheY-like chemotaxis protein
MEAFHATIPAAVVLDLGLPIMSGQEVCREIRRESLTVPIIILSALSDVRHKVLLGNGGGQLCNEAFQSARTVGTVALYLNRGIFILCFQQSPRFKCKDREQRRQRLRTSGESRLN